jgi:hypothetical protein
MPRKRSAIEAGCRALQECERMASERTDYLVEARQLVPDAKRVLLTAYGDTEAAIAALFQP